MRRHLNLLGAAAENVACNASTYAVAVAGLALTLTVLLCGVAIGEGLKAQALAGVQAGADVYCTWDVFGRDAAVPVERVAPLADVPGVVRAVPRILGRLQLGDRLAIVVGVPLREITATAVPVEGTLPVSPEQVLVGRELARAEGLVPGQRLLLEANTNRIFTVAGILNPSASTWSSKIILVDLDEAAALFGEHASVSDVCLYTRPGYETPVAEAIQRLDSRYRVQTKEFVHHYVLRGMTLREGAFGALAAVGLALAIPVFALFTHLGHAPRRREIALYKAEGWRTSDVLEMVAFENVLISVLVAGGSVLAAALWVVVLRAPLLAPFFVPDLPAFPAVRIPARFLPLPAILALVLSLAVTMTGSLYATWRSAVTRPADVLR
jgi:ABC-type lipoprotein release transport system permease subunit